MAEAPLAADLAGALLSDSELVANARQGDRRAFGTLYLRHHDAAWRVACAAASSGADAEDAVAEGFTRVFAALPRIVDREIAFRPYLLACVRNAATDRHRRGKKIDLTDEVPESRASLGPAEPGELVLADLERNLVGEALKSLPERWRTVLWLTEVEGMTPTEVSAVIGIKPNAVAALAYRAREGLREAYLQAHVKAEAKADCRYTVDRLGPYVRGELAEREKTRVQAHLDGCVACRQRRDELADVNAGLLGALAPVPLVLGARSQQEWLATAGRKGKGARRARTPSARAAQVAAITTSDLAQKGMAVVVALLLLLGGGLALNGLSGDGRHEAPLAAPPKGTGVPFNAVPYMGDTATTSPEASGGARPPGRPSTKPHPRRSTPTTARPTPSPGSVAVEPAAPPATPVTEAPPAPTSATAPTPAPTTPAPAPTPAPPAPKPAPAAATAASVGGSEGAVVGASVPDENQDPNAPPEAAATAGGQAIVGDKQEADGTGVSAGGSQVPPAVSDAAGAVSDTIPVDDPAGSPAPPADEVPAAPGTPDAPVADQSPVPAGGEVPPDPVPAPTGASGINSGQVSAASLPH